MEVAAVVIVQSLVATVVVEVFGESNWMHSVDNLTFCCCYSLSQLDCSYLRYAARPVGCTLVHGQTSRLLKTSLVYHVLLPCRPLQASSFVPHVVQCMHGFPATMAEHKVLIVVILSVI